MLPNLTRLLSSILFESRSNSVTMNYWMLPSNLTRSISTENCLNHGVTVDLNPLTPKICLVIPPSCFSTFLCILFKRIWVITRQYSPVDNYLSSHHLSALKHIDIVRRSNIGITSGSERFKVGPSA